MPNPNKSEPSFDVLVCVGLLAGLSYAAPKMEDEDRQEIWSARGSAICAQMVLDVGAMTGTTAVPAVIGLGRALELEARKLDRRPPAHVASTLGTVIDMLGEEVVVASLPIRDVVSLSCALNALGEARRLALEWDSDPGEAADQVVGSLSAWCTAAASAGPNLGALVDPLVAQPDLDQVRACRAAAEAGVHSHIWWILRWIDSRGEREMFAGALAAARRRMGARQRAS